MPWYLHYLLKHGYLFSLIAVELEELKPNYVYGGRGAQPHLLTASTDLGGLENTRQVRSNTYDDPRSDLAAASGTTAANGATGNPTYETIQSAKNGMLIAGGPPVLNPVYGPTGTPNTPTSPHPPPSKAAPNPVYAESGVPQQLPDVSALNPVYAPIGKPESLSPLSDSTAPRYANPHTTLTNGVLSLPEPSKGAGYPPTTPMYEELGATKDSMGLQVRESMTKNESYGLLGREATSETPVLLENGSGVDT